MTRPRLALADLMVLTALCALGITVVRWAVDDPSEEEVSEGIAIASPLFLALGFSIYRALRRGRPRAFWVAFGTASGLAGLGLFALVWLDAPAIDWYDNVVVEPAMRGAYRALGLGPCNQTPPTEHGLDFWGLDVPLILALCNVPCFVPALALGWLVQRYRVRLTIGQREPASAGAPPA